MTLAAISYCKSLLYKGMQGVLGALPGACDVCRRPGREAVCATCRGRMAMAAGARCIQCGIRLPVNVADAQAVTDTRCGRCLADPPWFDRILLVTEYCSPQRELLLSFKFSQQLHLASFFSRQMALVWLEASLPPPDFLVPVPLSRARLQQRGYNQALELARGVHRLALPSARLAVDLLRRSKDTPAQAQLSGAARRKNMSGVFNVQSRYAAALAGRHVVLVDDVMTSGATLNAAAKVLRSAGVGTVTGLIFARTDVLRIAGMAPTRVPPGVPLPAKP